MQFRNSKMAIKYVDQLNLIDGVTYWSLVSLLPQPSVGQLGLIKWAG